VGDEAIRTSPGRGFIEEVQDFLFHFARPYDIEQALVGQLDDFDHLVPDLFGGLRAPFPELSVQALSEDVHGSSPPSRCRAETVFTGQEYQKTPSLTIEGLESAKPDLASLFQKPGASEVRPLTRARAPQ
jgi:hypothetical protein